MNTTSNQSHPAPHRENVRLWALWFAIFGAPAAWTLQELVSAAFSSHACFPYATPRTEPTFSWLTTLVAGLGIVSFAVAVFALLTAWRAWKRTAREHGGSHHQLLEVGEGRTRFMAMSGMIVSTIFMLNIILNTVTVLFTAPCE